MSDYPPDYSEPICRPLTIRQMLGGIPLVLVVLIPPFALFVMAKRLYVLLVLVPVIIKVARWAYAKDPWAVAAWATHIKMTYHNKTKLKG